jgi:DNA primase
MPSASVLSWLEKATALYEEQLDQALTYLEGRGISEATARAARLGVVGTPAPTHDRYQGRLCIPYVTPAGVIGLKFRAIGEADPKYLCLPNSRPSLYNVLSFFTASDTIAVSEGELDALILTQAGIPAVGCPGVSTWQEHHPRCFTGYDRVLVFADGDTPGHDLAKRISRDLEQAQVIHCPDGMDVTDVYLAEGAYGLRKRAGL